MLIFLLESNGGTPEEDLAFDFIDIAFNKKIVQILENFIYFIQKENHRMMIL